MSYVKHITLTNWGPFLGETTLQLPAGPIAVTARRDRDPLSSNWIGKTWLLSAVRFALFGAKPSSAESEDSWITLGQRTGKVCVVLSDGVSVTRTRKLGSATQLEVSGLPGAPGLAKGDRAQAELDAYLCMSLADFDASCWIGQKAAAKLVLATPAARAAMVEAWIGVTPLRAAEAYATKRAGAALAERDQQLMQASALLDTAPEHAELAPLVAVEVAARGALSAIEASDKANERRAELQKQADQFDVLVKRGEELSEELGKIDRPAIDVSIAKFAREYETARDASTLATRRATELEERVTGEGFDGVCPVMCQACPVAPTVSSTVRTMQGQLTEAKREATQARAHSIKCDDLYSAARLRAKQWDQADAERTQLRAQALALEPALDALEALPAPMVGQVSPQVLRERLRAAERACADARASNAVHDTAHAKAKALQAKAAPAQAEATLWTIAATVIRAARREISEAAAGAIELGANRLLSAAGIELQASFRWEREASGLASNCDQCGEGYPSKVSVKVCPRCSAPRPPKVVERLDLIPSDRSGAADDLAGLAVQLSAASWLRAQRGSPFGSVFVDEPFAALDPSNAQALGVRLHAALGELGFEQAWIVAHDAALMQSLPAQVIVRSDGRSSRAEVQGG